MMTDAEYTTLKVSIELAEAVEKLIENEGTQTKGGIIAMLFTSVAVNSGMNDQEIDTALEATGNLAKAIAKEMRNEV